MYTLQKNFFADTSREDIIVAAKKEGFSPKLIHDKAGFVYEKHQHRETKLLVCLEGGMQVTVDGISFTFEPADKLIIPSSTPHAAIVGSTGCLYYWSEKYSMDIEKIVSDLKITYAGKDVIVQKSEGFAEIIVEIEPTKDHPEKSMALAIVGKSKPHFHKASTEIYEVIQGTLTLIVDGQKHLLKEKEKFTILPDQIHSAQGDEVWFLIYSTPGWTKEDHNFIL